MSAGKMGFWAVLAFVVSSQVGSGVFLFPHTMAPYGLLGLASWALAGLGALCLAFLFAALCRIYPETGGPHVYVTKVFGRRAGFYVAWTYWVLAWLSSAPVLGTIAAALCAFFGWPQSGWLLFLIESTVLLGLTLLNLRGVEASGRWEMAITAAKMFPLVLFPVMALFFLCPDHLSSWNPSGLSSFNALSQAAMMALWGFLGVEAVTAPAGSVVNAEKTIPKALIWGTLIVLGLYVLNHIAVMGLLSRQELSQDVMPYGAALQHLWGDGSQRLMSFFVAIVCLGAMNAWVLAMGQVAKGAADMGFFPPFFSGTNKKGAPYGGIVVSSALLFVCLLLLSTSDLAQQIRFVIDVSVLASVAIYGLCALVLLVLLLKSQGHFQRRITQWIAALGSLVFCVWIGMGAEISTWIWMLVLPVSAVPFHFLWLRKDRRNLV